MHSCLSEEETSVLADQIVARRGAFAFPSVEPESRLVEKERCCCVEDLTAPPAKVMHDQAVRQ